MTSFKCPQCNQIHEGWPAITFDAPFHYYNLSDDEKENIASLSDEFCTINYDDQTDRFIRAVLRQKVNNHNENLEYGVWVSLSEKNFNDYSENFNNPGTQNTYFGFLCSHIPGYEDTIAIKTNVVTGLGNDRPEIFPHADQIDNDFVRDYYEGISREEAEKRLSAVIHGEQKK